MRNCLVNASALRSMTNPCFLIKARVATGRGMSLVNLRNNTAYFSVSRLKVLSRSDIKVSLALKLLTI